jgi:ATP-dependent RNA circularization protein (DNA/RNA ligase family)
MKITKQRLKEIIREELSTVSESDWYDDENETRADRKYADSQSGLGDLQSDEKFTGGSPEEQMLRRIKARELLAAMSREELKDFAMSLDAETVAELRHLLANPMYRD